MDKEGGSGQSERIGTSSLEEFRQLLGEEQFKVAGGKQLDFSRIELPAAAREEFASRAQNAKASTSRTRIKKDLNRTFHAFANSHLTNEKDLEAILCMLTLDGAQDTIKYCQGMNFVAGFLLTRFRPELTYYITKQLLVNCNLQVLFQSHSPALSHYIDHFHSLLSTQSPSLAMHLSKHDFGPSLYAVEWFTTLYTTCVPPVAAELILALLYCQNIDNVLLRFGVGVLLELEHQLLRMKLETILSNFKSMVKKVDLARAFRRAFQLPAAPDILLQWMETGGPATPATFSPGYRTANIAESLPGWTRRGGRGIAPATEPSTPHSTSPSKASSPASSVTSSSSMFPEFPAHLTDRVNPLAMDVLSGKLGSVEDFGLAKSRQNRTKVKDEVANAEEACYQELVASWDEETRLAIGRELAMRIDITIWQYVMVDDHVEYQILITDQEAGLRWCVFRRYSEFHRTHLEVMRLRSKQLRVPRLPPKRWFGNLAAKNVIDRFQGLQRYVADLFPPLPASSSAISPAPLTSDMEMIFSFMAHDAHYISQIARRPRKGSKPQAKEGAGGGEGGSGITAGDGRRRRVRLGSMSSVPDAAVSSKDGSAGGGGGTTSVGHKSSKSEEVAVMRLDLEAKDVVVPLEAEEAKEESKVSEDQPDQRPDGGTVEGIHRSITAGAVGDKRRMLPPSHPLALNFSDEEDDDTAAGSSERNSTAEDTRSVFSFDGLVAGAEEGISSNVVKQRIEVFSLPVVLAFYRLDAYVLDCLKLSKSRLSSAM